MNKIPGEVDSTELRAINGDIDACALLSYSGFIGQTTLQEWNQMKSHENIFIAFTKHKTNWIS